MTEEAKFVTTGVLDEAFFRRNARYLISPKFERKRLILLAVIVGLCLVSYFLQPEVYLLVLLLFCIVYFVISTLHYRKKAADTLIKRTRETVPDGHVALTVSCTEQGVRSENHVSGGVTLVEYANLDTLAMGEGAMILMSKAGQFTVLFTDSITEQEAREMRCFLEEKCPKLKIIT